MIRSENIKYSFRRRWAILVFLLSIPLMLGAQSFTVKVDKHANCDDVGGAVSISGVNPDAHSVTWTDASGATISTSTSVTGLKSGSYFATVKLKVCDKEIFRGSARVKKTPGFDVNISASGSIVQPCDKPRTGTVTLTANIIGGSGGTSYRYRWSTGSSSKSISVKDPGTYSVSVSTATSKCDASDNVTIRMREVECSHDPNDIRGPEGYGEQQFVSVTSRMNYTIRFENDPDFATAPAKKVTVTLPLDEHIKLSSFRLSNVGFGSFDFAIPEDKLSHTEIYDVADSLGVLVRLTAGVNVVNQEAFWIFESIDPETGTDPESALLGFLLVNDSLGRGEGFVNFSLEPSAGSVTGDTIFAKATIVFDENASLETNLWFNTVDAGLPTSGLKDVVPNSADGQLAVSFNATDDAEGAGVKDVTLYVAENDGGYQELGKYHPDSTALFSGVIGNIYNLFSIAEDNTGNREPMKSTEDYMFDISEAPTGMWLSNNMFDEFTSLGSVIGTLSTRGNDFSESYTYALVAGDGDTDNALFAIDGEKLVTATQFDCLPSSSFSVRVQTTNYGGYDYQQQFSVFMNNVYNETDTIDEYIELCEGDEIQKGGIDISLPGEYIIDLQSVHGCDSVVRATVVNLPRDYIKLQASICEGETYLFKDLALNTSGVYYDSLLNVLGCDSIVELTLNVNPKSMNNIAATICEGESYSFNGQTLTTTGDYTATLKNMFDCDSVVNLALTVYDVDTTWTEPGIVELVNGASYNFLGDELTKTGTYYKTFQSINNCDSVVGVQILAGPIAVAGDDFQTPEGATVQVDASASSDPDNDPLSYLWTGEGIVFQNATAAITSFTAPSVNADSVFVIQLTVSDGSLDAMDELMVTVLNSVGVIDIANDGRIKIWPNPVSGILHIATSGIIIDALELIDASGKTVLIEPSIGTTDKTLELGHIPKGMYTIKLTSKTDVFVAKIMVQ